MKYGISALLGLVTGFTLYCVRLQEAPMTSPREPSSTPSGYTCRLHTNDVGDIVAHGSTKNEAYANAAEKCYEKRESQYRQIRHKNPGMDQGEDMALSCVNLSCKYEVI